MHVIGLLESTYQKQGRKVYFGIHYYNIAPSFLLEEIMVAVLYSGALTPSALSVTTFMRHTRLLEVCYDYSWS